KHLGVRGLDAALGLSRKGGPRRRRAAALQGASHSYFHVLRYFSATLTGGFAMAGLSSTANWLRSRPRKVSSVERIICAPRDAIWSIRSVRRPIKEAAD